MENEQMDIIAMTRKLGAMLQQDDRYTAYHLAKQANDQDEDLQKLIGEFNLKPDKDRDKLTALDGKIKELYGQIMANKNMAVFNNVKNAMDELLSQINMIITMSANGEDPATCSVEHSCGGNCSSCGGCH